MTWTAPQAPREYAPREAGERESLEGWLDFHRATLLHKCAGLTAEQLKKQAVPPSPLSLLGLVRHMADVERWWFRRHAAGEDIAALYDPDDIGADFNDLATADAEADLEVFAHEAEASREVARGMSLDTTVPSLGHHPERMRNIRWIYQHMIEEYARHNGHADLLRECIDGTTGL